jgi:hypothetical protein
VDYEAEFRQPLLQGAGVEFNRIAGPNSSGRRRRRCAVGPHQHGRQPGRLRGRRDRTWSRDVEQAYWDLYFAYRDLDAKIQVATALW